MFLLSTGGSTRIDELTARNLNEAALKTTSSSKLKVSAESVQNLKAEVVLMPCPAPTNQRHSKEKKGVYIYISSRNIYNEFLLILYWII